MKRKLDEDFEYDRKIEDISSGSGDAHQDLRREVRKQVEILESTFSPIEADRASAKHAVHILADLAKNGSVSAVNYSSFFCFISVNLSL